MTQQPKEKSGVIKLKLRVFTLHHAPTANSDSTLIVETDTARALHRQLGELLGEPSVCKCCENYDCDCMNDYGAEP